MYKLISYLLQPYVMALLLMGLANVYYWRKRVEQRRSKLWLLLPFFLLVALSTPLISYLSVGSLEWQYPPQNECPTDVEAIVVLEGGGSPPDGWRERPELSLASLLRTLHAARLYQQSSPRPVVVTGSKMDANVSGPPFVDLMAELLVKQGVSPSDVIVGQDSRSTYENAVECRKLLEKRGIRRIVLVTDAIHLPRAVRCFRKQGFDVVPSGCHYRATEFEPSLYLFLPGVGAISGNEEAVHEWIGLASYWFAGRI